MLRNSNINYEIIMTYVDGLSTKEDLEFFENLVLDNEKAFITNANSTEIFKVKEKKIFESDKLTIR
jgi:pyruvate formate lyase activating enzyme